MSIREVMDFPNYNKIFRGGKMELKPIDFILAKIDDLNLSELRIVEERIEYLLYMKERETKEGGKSEKR